MGLRPGNPVGSYVQNVPLVRFKTKPSIKHTIGGERSSLKFIEDFVHDFPQLVPKVDVKISDVVFAGYGIAASQYDWGDYKGVVVRNKLVIALSGEPSRPDCLVHRYLHLKVEAI